MHTNMKNFMRMNTMVVFETKEDIFLAPYRQYMNQIKELEEELI